MNALARIATPEPRRAIVFTKQVDGVRRKGPKITADESCLLELNPAVTKPRIDRVRGLCSSYEEKQQVRDVDGDVRKN